METIGNIFGRKIEYIPLDLISPNPAQPRVIFDTGSLESLAASIKEHGLLSPLLVRRIGIERYELIAGERRLRAMKMLGYTKCEALVISAFDLDSAIISLIENIQRDQLNFMEEAEACLSIIKNHGISQENLAKRLGKSPSALANRLRLLKLPGNVRKFISESGLSERHARALLKADDPSVQLKLAKDSISNRLTVRQLEKKIENLKKTPARNIKNVYRDMRLYVNAVMEMISRLREMGADAESEIIHTDVGFDIVIHIASTNGT